MGLPVLSTMIRKDWDAIKSDFGPIGDRLLTVDSLDAGDPRPWSTRLQAVMNYCCSAREYSRRQVRLFRKALTSVVDQGFKDEGVSPADVQF